LNLDRGARLGPYEITGLIGAGGMGEVYRARDTRLGRDVAIKVIPARLAGDPARRDRLMREARAISSLAHPNICTLFDVGEKDGAEYLVMEYLDGETLADATARGALPLEQVIRYGAQIADAIGAAHRQGIVHRDLKPGNVMITRSGAKVLDFGLATSHEEAPTDATAQKPLTEAGQVVGTLQYMAPEQLRGADADARSDMFALGAILYEMATGRRAFEGKNRTSVVASILEAQPPSIDAIQPMSPPALDHLIRKCLEKNPDDRLQNASDLAFALREITQPQTVEPARARRAWIAIAAFAAVLVIAVAASWFIARRRTATDAAAPKTIAVIPFSSLGVDKSRDYLLLAIPDEITTILTYSPTLAVRPFSASRRVSADIDPQDAAKKLNAGAIVSGHLLDANGKLNVTLEAIDAANDKLLWRDVFEVASADLITMRGELNQRIRAGLLPRLAGGAAAVPEPSTPQNAEAYALYLRAASLPSDSERNAEGLRLLEDAVRLDPNFAAAWAALSLRAYYETAYHQAGDVGVRRSEEAALRALQIDPNLIDAASQLIILRTERGDTINALHDAKDLLAKRPSSSAAHFNLSYVYRYGGALPESAAECNQALELDRGNRGLRSCATTFNQSGDMKRAMDFIQLDPDSVLGHRLQAQVFLRERKFDEAVNAAPPGPFKNLLSSWRKGDQKGIDTAAANIIENATKAVDSEPYVSIGSFFSLVGRPHLAVRLLAGASKKNLCWAANVDRDPLYEAVRALPEYPSLHQEAVRCHDRFMAELSK
jgi:serine/threonine protein kinase/Tfp pilus assembly protein PilF